MRAHQHVVELELVDDDHLALVVGRVPLDLHELDVLARGPRREQLQRRVHRPQRHRHIVHLRLARAPAAATAHRPGLRHPPREALQLHPVLRHIRHAHVVLRRRLLLGLQRAQRVALRIRADLDLRVVQAQRFAGLAAAGAGAPAAHQQVLELELVDDLQLALAVLAVDLELRALDVLACGQHLLQLHQQAAGAQPARREVLEVRLARPAAAADAAAARVAHPKAEGAQLQPLVGRTHPLHVQVELHVVPRHRLLDAAQRIAIHRRPGVVHLVGADVIAHAGLVAVLVHVRVAHLGEVQAHRVLLLPAEARGDLMRAHQHVVELELVDDDHLALVVGRVPLDLHELDVLARGPRREQLQRRVHRPQRHRHIVHLRLARAPAAATAHRPGLRHPPREALQLHPVLRHIRHAHVVLRRRLLLHHRAAAGFRHVGDSDAHRRGVRAAVTVGDRVAEAVAAEEVRVRRIGDGVVGVDRDAAVRRRTDCRHRQGVAVHVDVVGEHCDPRRRVFVHRMRIVHRVGRIVHAADGDRHGRARARAGKVSDGVAEGIRQALADLQSLQRQHCPRVVGVGAVCVHRYERAARARRIQPHHLQHVQMVRVGVVREQPASQEHMVFVDRTGVGHRRRPGVDQRDHQLLEVLDFELEALELEFVAVAVAVAVAAKEGVEVGDVFLHRGEQELAVRELELEDVVAAAAVVVVARAEVLGHRVDRAVVAAAGVDPVAARAAVDDVVALVRLELVVAGAAEEAVVALAALEPVAAGAAVEEIVALAAVQPVVAGVADQLVVAAAAVETVVPRAADQHIVTAAPEILLPHGFSSPGLPVRKTFRLCPLSCATRQPISVCSITGLFPTRSPDAVDDPQAVEKSEDIAQKS